MSGFKYRLSIIPAGAITDHRLVEAPRALQVLCLIGRHIDDNGWCRRSQVQMSRELKCARSTVQAALEILYDTGWVERRLEGRGKTAPDPEKAPFAAHSYRVVLDRDEASRPIVPTPESDPERGVPDQPAPPSISEGGCPTDRQGVPDQPAPLEGIPSEGKEREARARASDFEKRWDRLRRVYPDAAADDLDHARLLLSELGDRDQAVAAGDGLDRFVTWFRRPGKRKRPFLQQYLKDRRWEMTEDVEPAKGDQPEGEKAVWVDAFSRAWWFLYHRFVQLHGAALRDRNSPVAMALSRQVSLATSAAIGWKVEAGQREAIEAAAAATLVAAPVDGALVAAVRARYSADYGISMPLPDKDGIWVFVKRSDAPLPDPATFQVEGAS